MTDAILEIFYPMNFQMRLRTCLDKDACGGGQDVVSGVLSFNHQVVTASLLVVQRLLQSHKTPESHLVHY